MTKLIKTVKKSIKQMYIVRLENQIKPAIDTFGEDHPYVAGYQEVIRKIKAL